MKISDLPWHKKNSSSLLDSISRCSSIEEIKKITSFALDLNETELLYSKLVKINPSKEESLKQKSIAILCNGLTSFITKSLIVSGLRFNLLFKVYEYEFNQVIQNIANPQSSLYNDAPDFILLFLDYRGLPLTKFSQTIIKDFDSSLLESIDYLYQLVATIRLNCKSTIFINTLPIPLGSVLGNIDTFSQYGFRKLIYTFNQYLQEQFLDKNIQILDLAYVASVIGLENWYDDKFWHFAKIPFSHKALPFFSDYITRVINACSGYSKKVLVIDLDNTIWGGIVGDDGIEGIKIGVGDPIAEAYYQVQKVIKGLIARGIVVVVSSKNEADLVKKVFHTHPGMLLKEEDISLFMVNWEDKAENIKSIALQLNVNTDSMVFMDDNPFERDRIRHALPEVFVLELTNDPGDFAAILNNCGYFETTGITEEDFLRPSFYKQNIRRLELKKNSPSLDVFLESLEMKIQFGAFCALEKERILQLLNKTNQFNLTNQKYTESDLSKFENNNNYYTLKARLEDKFGDNGIISALICSTSEQTNACWKIHNWVMSCRVFGRKVEKKIFNELILQAKQKNIEVIEGEYYPTNRNMFIKDLFPNLGFIKIKENSNYSIWILNVKDYHYEEVSCIITT
ncbi:TPA: HAD-IIIC family phosphatase [Legionella pneumophila]|nr:HAD-IIIC family phosphatase [Legionella pneumophila]